MDCTEARYALWPPERPRLAGADVLEARQHVEACEACRSYFEQDKRLLSAYDRISRERTPRPVRERVFDSLARERARGLGVPDAPGSTAGTRPAAQGGLTTITRRRLALAAASSIAALFVFAAGSVLRDSPTPQEEASLFVEDYLRRAVGEDRIDTSDAQEISRFLTRELGLPITLMEVEGLRLAGAEICLLDGRRGAMIRYVENGQEISHYVVPKSGAQERAPAVSSQFASGNAVGPSVITWATTQVEQALVGEVDAERLIDLARNAAS